MRIISGKYPGFAAMWRKLVLMYEKGPWRQKSGKYLDISGYIKSDHYETFRESFCGDGEQLCMSLIFLWALFGGQGPPTFLKW